MSPLAPSPDVPRSRSLAVARAVALFVGGFALANLAGELAHARFDASRLLIDPRPLAARPVLALCALALLAWGLAPHARRARHAAVGALGVLALFALRDAARYYAALARGAIHTAVPVPFSLVLVLAFALVARQALAARTPARHARTSLLLALAGCAVAFPLAQMALFGATDYRRAADAVVVFGARAYADGTPSIALGDRVRTACELYRDGLARTVVVSGGPGDGDVHETESMRRLAVALGVPARDIVVDTGGLTTADTVRNTLPIFARLGARRVLAVSHFYHLPRVKLAYARAGLEVYTVPARQTRVLHAMPRFVAREVAALWAYWARG